MIKSAEEPCRGTRCGEGTPYESGDGGGGGPVRPSPESDVIRLIKKHAGIPVGIEIHITNMQEDIELGKELLDNKEKYIKKAIRVEGFDEGKIINVRSFKDVKVKVESERQAAYIFPNPNGKYPYRIKIIGE